MRKMIKTLLPVIAFFMGMLQGNSQNLLNLDDWLPGTGSAGTFTMNGTAAENIREWGEGPGGQRVVLWKSIPDGGNNADGGWVSSQVAINPDAMYRFTVWIKKENVATGNTYLGCIGSVLRLDGTADTNPYFFSSKLPESNKWYLLVGYIHGSSDSSIISLGSVYDGNTGTKVAT